MSAIDRVLKPLGLMRRSRIKATAFNAARQSRLTADWLTAIMTADQEARTSLTALRARSRTLVNNNDYAKRVVQLVRQNIIGPYGIKLQSRIPQEIDSLADQTNREIESAFRRWGRLGSPTADGRRSWLDVQNLVLGDLVVDGEVFIRLLRGRQFGPFGFALQFLDPDSVDVWLNRPRRASNGVNGSVVENEISMGVEVNEWGRPVAYHLREQSSYAAQYGVGGGMPAASHQRVPASEIRHIYIPLRANSTRGIPWMHTAMTVMHMLAGYEEAELVAARTSAAKMGFFTSKTGDDYSGQPELGADGKPTGNVITEAAPGTFEQLPEGMDFKPFDPQHPNAAFGEFIKVMIRSMAMGNNLSYHSLSGDNRDVNFSSIRVSLLEERDYYRSVQSFAIEHLCDPIFAEWLEMAFLTNQLPLRRPVSEPDVYRDNVVWQPRGWQWVDPLNDVKASLLAIDSGLSTYANEHADRGTDWREEFDQRVIEEQRLEEIGLRVNRSTVGAAQPQNDGAQQDQQSAPGRNQ